MEYYYLKNRLRYGPVKFEELKSKDIKKDTLVWYEGLKDWTKAGEIKELKELFKVKPPPIPPPPIPPPPPAPKKEFKTPTPPPLPKKKVIIEEVKEEIKEPSTLPPSIVKKEKNLSPPAIKTSPIKKTNQTEAQEKDNEIGPPPIRNSASSNENFGKRPLIIIILFVLSLVFSPYMAYLYIETKEYVILNYGLWFYIFTWVTLIVNFCAFLLTFLMYRIGPIIYVISQLVSLIYTLIAGVELETLTNTILFSIIYTVIMFSYYKRMK